MNTENLSTLKIHKLTQDQYDRELAAGRIDPNALYLTPDEEVDLSAYATKEELNEYVNETVNALVENRQIGNLSESEAVVFPKTKMEY